MEPVREGDAGSDDRRESTRDRCQQREVGELSPAPLEEHDYEEGDGRKIEEAQDGEDPAELAMCRHLGRGRRR